jgi:hypothetical protein
MGGVQIQIQFQNTHARLAKKAKLPAQCVLLNQHTNVRFI